MASSNNGTRLNGRPPIQRTSRSWTNNGVHHNAQRYVGPGVFLEMNTMSTTSTRPQRSQGSGLLGTAFNLLGTALVGSQQMAQERRARSTRQTYAEDEASDEDEYEDDGAGRRRPRSVAGLFAEKLLGTQRPQQRASRGGEQASRRQDSAGARGTSRSSTNQADGRRQSYAGGRQAYVDDYSDEDYEEDDDDDYDIPKKQAPRRAFTADDASTIEALENAAEHHQREMKRCHRQLETASRQPAINSSKLQQLVSDLKRHEKAHLNAVDNLRMAKGGSDSRNQSRKADRQTRPSRPEPSSRRSSHRIFTDDDFTASSHPRRRNSSYVGSANFDNFGTFGSSFAAFDQVLNTLHQGSPFMNTFFGTPHATFTFTTQSNNRPRASTRNSAQSQQPFSFSPPPPTPPPTLLKPDEVKRLFKTYNDRWNTLPMTDPNIPYPTRNLKSISLSIRNTIWAPKVRSPISDWSDEVVMQANAQAFFLGVVDLIPNYSDAGPTGRITMGYDRAKANAVQVKALVDLLKKEKSRWHSDRLGRRNGGGDGGPNEGLQSDPRARAVFHAVCELMEFANGS